MVWYQIRAGVIGFLNLAQGVLLVHCVLSWFVDRNSPVMRFLTRVTDPVLQPIRRVMLRNMRSPAGAAFAPLVAILLIQLLSRILWGL
jgi:uncharacterized protein YggT (Ycf19 family)